MKNLVMAMLVAGALTGVPVSGNSAHAADEEDADFVRGRTVATVCRGCHTVNLSQASLMKGPSLSGIMGRKAGTLKGYTDYSDAMIKSGITWGPAAIERYIADPQAVIPGNKMAFVGIADPADRQAVVAYLSKVTVADPATREKPLVFTLRKAVLGPGE